MPLQSYAANAWADIPHIFELNNENAHRVQIFLDTNLFDLRLLPYSLLHVGPQPLEQYGTRASFGLSANIDTSCWSAAVTSPPGDMVALSICSAPDAPIGRYTLTLGRSGQIEFILLFNPWCTGGQTEHKSSHVGITVYRVFSWSWSCFMP